MIFTLQVQGQDPPANDTCEDAIAISCGQTLTGNTEFASASSQSPSCTGGSLEDVYYKFTGLPGQNYTVTVNGDNYDGVLAAYSGACDGEEIACADDGLSSGVEETISFTVSSIQTVYIQTYDWSAGGGDYSLTLSCSGTPSPPSNNNCFNSDFINVGQTLLGSTFSATPDGPEIECGAGGDGTQNDVWYRFTAPNGSVSIETSSTGIGNIDTQLQVLDGCGGAILGCNEDGGVGFASLLEFECGELNPGQLYYIQVDGYSGNNVNFNITLSSESCPAPSNDLPCNATALSCGDFVSGTTVGASSNERCGSGNERLGVWYVLDVDSPSEVSLETCFEGTTFDTDISVFTGSCGDLECYSGFSEDGYDDGEAACEFSSFAAGGPGAVFTAPAGSYYILISGFSFGLAGNFDLSVSCESLIPDNDDCEDAIAISCGQSVSGNTEFASSSGQSPTCASGNFQDVYYKFTGLPGQNYTVTVNGDDYDGVLAAYTGSCDGVLNEIACADNGAASGVEESISFSVPFIQTVYIQTYDWFSSGDYTLTLSCSGAPTPPNNDNCFNSSLIAVGETVLGTTFSATPDGPEIECGFGGDGTQNDVWYRFLAPNGSLAIETSSTGIGSIDTQIQVLDGCVGTVLGCNEDYFGLESFLAFDCGDLNPGQLYYIQVDGFNGDNINFNLSLSSDACPVPENDLPCNATTLNCGDLVSGTTVGATPDAKCGFAAERLGVWYVLDIDNPSEVSLETCFEETTYDTDISLFTGTCGDLECFTGFSGDGYLDGDFDCEFQTFAAGGEGAVFNAPEGTYYILIHGFTALGAGNFELSVSCEPLPPPNDSACDAIEVSCGDVVSGTNMGATSDFICSGGVDRPGVWYELNIDTESEVSLETCLPGTDFDTDISVFTGSCSSLNCFDGFNGTGYLDGVSSCEFNSWAAGGPDGVFTASPGTYYILVHGFSNTQIGNFELSVICESIEDNAISGSVNWNSDCGSRDATLELYETGTSNFAAGYTVIVASDGSFSATVNESGLHDLYLKVDGYLSKVQNGIMLSAGSNAVNFGSITPGDLTGNDAIGIGDFSGISSAYGTDSGDAGFNPLADFNCDGSINIQDYSSFSSNYGSVGNQNGL
ncbi:MAG: hypothetical protein LC664_02865 [Flavobacteriales bacterium]|nr:hypothetical protein [Flavobacteriales bacterium]